jgi:hypothetical protein
MKKRDKMLMIIQTNNNDLNLINLVNSNYIKNYINSAEQTI